MRVEKANTWKVLISYFRKEYIILIIYFFPLPVLRSEQCPIFSLIVPETLLMWIILTEKVIVKSNLDIL